MRGPRWLKTHSVSEYSCVIPTRLGWHTYVDGEFGLQYGSYMSFSYGRGGLYLTTLDLGCNLDDPAAMKVAGAVFRSFADGEVAAVRPVVPCGERLTKYAVDHLCCEEGAKAADEANAVETELKVLPFKVGSVKRNVVLSHAPAPYITSTSSEG